MSGIQRDLQAVLESKVDRGKVLLLIGPRQVGKTTLLKSMMENCLQIRRQSFGIAMKVMCRPCSGMWTCWRRPT